MKLCKRCNKVKPLADFGRRGDNGKPKTYCRQCTNAYLRDLAARNRESRREYFRRWWDGKKELRRQRDNARYDPVKASARRAVKMALRRGTMRRGPCVVCNSAEVVEAHHFDYARPLDVIWLCSHHHKDVHYGRLRIACPAQEGGE